MAWFRKRKTMNEILAEEAGLSLGPTKQPTTGPLEPEPKHRFPDWYQTELLLKGVASEWDALVSAEAPGLRGDEVEFVGTEDGSLIVYEEQGDESLDPLARAVEDELAPPYHAKGVRKSDTTWAVGARRTQLVELETERCNELQVAVNEGHRSVEGEAGEEDVTRLQEIGRAGGFDSYVVRAARVDGKLWELEISPL